MQPSWKAWDWLRAPNSSTNTPPTGITLRYGHLCRGHRVAGRAANGGRMTYSTIAPTDGPPPDRAGACEDILGYRVTTISKGACLRQILGWIEGAAKGRYIACLNPHSIEIARRDAAFPGALHDADLAVPERRWGY